MPLSLEEMTAVAIRNQHLILAEELKKGVPLNYRDELGRNILEYPDGHIEITQDVIPPYIQNQMKPCNHDRFASVAQMVRGRAPILVP